jgi:hypothetical protein
MIGPKSHRRGLHETKQSNVREEKSFMLADLFDCRRADGSRKKKRHTVRIKTLPSISLLSQTGHQSRCISPGSSELEASPLSICLIAPKVSLLSQSIPPCPFHCALGAWAYWLSNAVVIDPKTKCIAAWSHDGWLNAFCSRPEGFSFSRSQLIAYYSWTKGSLNPGGQPSAPSSEAASCRCRGLLRPGWASCRRGQAGG